MDFQILERESVTSLYIFRRSDRRFSSSQEAKLFYAARATRGHRFCRVPTTPRGRDLFLLFYSLAKSHFMDGDLLRPGRPCYRSQNL